MLILIYIRDQDLLKVTQGLENYMDMIHIKCSNSQHSHLQLSYIKIQLTMNII